MRGHGLFVTGTDTGVGKTWTSVRLVRQWRSAGLDAVAMKPVECGGRGDATALRGAADDLLDLDVVNPCFIGEALAPAALAERTVIDLDRLAETCSRLREFHERVLVEGAGGWLVPLDRERTLADLARLLDLPVLVVAANRLGCLNHVLLTVRAIEAVGLECCGVYLNEGDPDARGRSGDGDLSRESNARVLAEILDGIPIFEGDPRDWAGRLPGGGWPQPPAA